MGAKDVLTGGARWSCEAADALEWLRSLPNHAASLVFFSPPYEDRRTYGIGCKLKGMGWVDWMRPVVAEAARVSAGLVVVNAAGQVRDHAYSPAVEWLVADLTRRDGLVCGPSPYAWVRQGIPGKNNYHRRDWEPLYAVCLPDRLPLSWTDPLAFGKPPVCRLGGEMTARDQNGRRRLNVPNRRPGGTKKSGEPGFKQRFQPEIANPGNVVRTTGGHVGHPLAHQGEAPMALALAERFVCWYAAPDSVVLDCFSGSGTTAHAAILHGRRFIGCDLRQSQVELTERRLRTVTPNLIPA